MVPIFSGNSGNWLNKNQILIDVGMHRTQEGIVHGDIDFNQAKDKVAWITPVPGGVGPMTIAMLLQNTWLAATLEFGQSHMHKHACGLPK